MTNDPVIHKHMNFYLLDKGRKPVWSFTRNSQAIAGVILDLSPFGGKVIVPHNTPLPVKQINIILSSVHTDKSLIMLPAKVLWTKDRSSLNYKELGCSFIKPSNSLKLILMDIIRQESRKNTAPAINCEIFFAQNSCEILIS